jgi:hypothetical protein
VYLVEVREAAVAAATSLSPAKNEGIVNVANKLACCLIPYTGSPILIICLVIGKIADLIGQKAN